MFEIDQVYNDKFVKFEVSLLISLSQKKEVDISRLIIELFSVMKILLAHWMFGIAYLKHFLLHTLNLLMLTLIAILSYLIQ